MGNWEVYLSKSETAKLDQNKAENDWKQAQMQKMQLDIGNEPFCHSNNTVLISWHKFFLECSK